MSESAKTRATVDALAQHKALDPNFLRERFGLRDTRRGVEIPYYTIDGSLGRQRLRRWTETSHPTEWLPGDGTLPYFDRLNREAAKARGELVIVEGESDVWTLTLHGIPPPGGAGSSMVKTIAREAVTAIPRLLVMREPDAGGANFVRDVRGHLRELGYAGEVFVFDLQATCGVKDPSALHVRGPEAFEAKWERARAAAIEAEGPAVPIVAGIAELPHAPEVPSEPIDGVALLDDIVDVYRRFVVMSAAQVDTLALYAIHTHAIDAADVTPYILLRSPEKRCGKTLTLLVSESLCRRVVLAANVTAAALFRLIDAEQPTYMIDEVDTIFGGHKSERNEDIRAILNSGYERGATIPRCVGEDHEVRQFSTYCAKMLAGLRCRLPDTILDRCIAFDMQRKPPGAKVERFRRRRVVPELHALRDRAVGWAAQNVDALATAEPELPDELNDRAQDVWESLLAIADRVGGEWPARARCAAFVLSGGEAAEDESLGVRLLADVRDYFENKERAPSAELVRHLVGLEESPWGHLDARGLARILRSFGVRPRTIRLDDGSTPKGYLREWFTDCFSRYLAPPPENPPQPTQAPKIKVLDAPACALKPPPNGDETAAGSQETGERGGQVSATGAQPPREKPHEIDVVADVADVAGLRNTQGPLEPGALSDHRKVCRVCQTLDLAHDIGDE